MKCAILIPCLNEQATISQVVRDCRRLMPEADVWVLDNASTDLTAQKAKLAGARVLASPLAGKGNAMAHGFRVIEADYYIMVDGDGTYPVEAMSQLLHVAIAQNFEMVCGSRLERGRAEAFRPLHYIGNHTLTRFVSLTFGYPVRDLLTGMRVFSRRYRDEVQIAARGFELEAEMTVRAIAQNMAFCEVDIPYVERTTGSESKLRTFRDGFLILVHILDLLSFFRPRLFFGVAALLVWALGIISGLGEMVPLSGLAAVFVSLGFLLSHLRRQETFRRRTTDGGAGKSGRDPSAADSESAA